MGVYTNSQGKKLLLYMLFASMVTKITLYTSETIDCKGSHPFSSNPIIGVLRKFDVWT